MSEGNECQVSGAENGMISLKLILISIDQAMTQLDMNSFIVTLLSRHDLCGSNIVVSLWDISNNPPVY